MTDKLKKFLTFDENSLTVTVHDTEEKATEGGDSPLGTFVHEFNIDPFSGVKYPVLEQHVLGLLREKTDDLAVKAAINLTSVHIVPGYEIDLPSSERNQSYDGVRQEDGHVSTESAKPKVEAKPRKQRVRKDKDGKDEVVEEGGTENIQLPEGDAATDTTDLPQANQEAAS